MDTVHCDQPEGGDTVMLSKGTPSGELSSIGTVHCDQPDDTLSIDTIQRVEAPAVDLPGPVSEPAPPPPPIRRHHHRRHRKPPTAAAPPLPLPEPESDELELDEDASAAAAIAIHSQSPPSSSSSSSSLASSSVPIRPLWDLWCRIQTDPTDDLWARYRLDPSGGGNNNPPRWKLPNIKAAPGGSAAQRMENCRTLWGIYAQVRGAPTLIDVFSRGAYKDAGAESSIVSTVVADIRAGLEVISGLVVIDQSLPTATYVPVIMQAVNNAAHELVSPPPNS